MSKIVLDAPAFRWTAPVKSGEQFTVHGQKASSYEWNVAWALEQAGLEYIFQVDYLGGRRLMGGLVVDFLVKTAPLSTPLWVNGDYWHTGKQATEDEMKKAMLYSMTSHECNKAVTFWGKDCSTKEAALSSVKRELL